jgi:hypothetical protein
MFLKYNKYIILVLNLSYAVYKLFIYKCDKSRSNNRFEKIRSSTFKYSLIKERNLIRALNYF